MSENGEVMRGMKRETGERKNGRNRGRRGGGLGEEYERERTEKSRENYLFDMIK